MLSKPRSAGEPPMTAPQPSQPQILPRTACTPAAIRAVLAANAAPAVLQRYVEDLDAAFEQAREHGDLAPLVQTVRRWWFEADAWRDPGAQRQFLARMDSYRTDGLPPPGQRMARQQVRAQFGVRRVYQWELDGPAQQELAAPAHAALRPGRRGTGHIPRLPSRSPRAGRQDPVARRESPHCV